jgi:hypothetical protein
LFAFVRRIERWLNDVEALLIRLIIPISVWELLTKTKTAVRMLGFPCFI